MSKFQRSIIILLGMFVVCLFGLLGGILFTRSNVPGVVIAFLAPPTPSPTNTPLPINTPSPMATPIPTDTPFPTNTPQPTSPPVCALSPYLERYNYFYDRLAQIDAKAQEPDVTARNPVFLVRLLEVREVHNTFLTIEPPDCAITLHNLSIAAMKSVMDLLTSAYNEGYSQQTQILEADAQTKAETARLEKQRLLAEYGMTSHDPTPQPPSVVCDKLGYLDQLKPLVNTFISLESTLSQAPLTTSESVMDAMQLTRVKLWIIDPPACAQKVHAAYLDAMELTIVAFTYYRQGDFAMFSTLSKQVMSKLDEAQQETINFAEP